jgi:hypothetical protein
LRFSLPRRRRSTPDCSGYRWLATVLVVLLLAGGAFLWWSTCLDEHEVWHHLVRDIGIAFLVSALVTGSYEGYLRQKVDLEKLESVLRTVAGSSIPVTVWQQIQLGLLARKNIRRQMHLQVSIKRSGAVPSLCELEYDLTYQLVSLSKGCHGQECRHQVECEAPGGAQLSRVLHAHHVRVDRWRDGDSGRGGMKAGTPADLPIDRVGREIRRRG